MTSMTEKPKFKLNYKFRRNDQDHKFEDIVTHCEITELSKAVKIVLTLANKNFFLYLGHEVHFRTRIRDWKATLLPTRLQKRVRIGSGALVLMVHEDCKFKALLEQRLKSETHTIDVDEVDGDFRYLFFPTLEGYLKFKEMLIKHEIRPHLRWILRVRNGGGIPLINSRLDLSQFLVDGEFQEELFLQFLEFGLLVDPKNKLLATLHAGGDAYKIQLYTEMGVFDPIAVTDFYGYGEF